MKSLLFCYILLNKNVAIALLLPGGVVILKCPNRGDNPFGITSVERVRIFSGSMWHQLDGYYSNICFLVQTNFFVNAYL